MCESPIVRQWNHVCERARRFDGGIRRRIVYDDKTDVVSVGQGLERRADVVGAVVSHDNDVDKGHDPSLARVLTTEATFGEPRPAV